MKSPLAVALVFTGLLVGVQFALHTRRATSSLIQTGSTAYEWRLFLYATDDGRLAVSPDWNAPWFGAEEIASAASLADGPRRFRLEIVDAPLEAVAPFATALIAHGHTVTVNPAAKGPPRPPMAEPGSF